jgi:site-specific DNA recombinase
MSPGNGSIPAPSTVRCAVYTRKSTEEGLDQQFNSLDAQRESAQAFIQSQAREGWICLPQRYDDGGFTGGNIDRPALRRLLDDMEARRIDAVVVYKVDRLSRSLLDFARLMERLERHQVSLVSVTQQFNTTHSMGRLTLNILLSFAQFEREIIAERTRDKMAATRRKGQWAGGAPSLGYDIDAHLRRLVVNPAEAEQVRAIFALYLERQGLIAVVQELAGRGWVSKRWTTRQRQVRGGRPFTKTRLHELLTNVLYIGQVRYKDEVHAGQQPALVDLGTWGRVQALLQEQGRAASCRGQRLRSGALLAGLLRCRPCGCAMTPAHATRGGRLRYRYYVCTQAQQRGWDSCPSKSLPAGEIERYVLEQVADLVHQPERWAPPLAPADQARVAQKLSGLAAGRGALLHEEQAHLLQMLVEGIAYDGDRGTVAVTFAAGGLQRLAQELRNAQVANREARGS